MVAAVGYAAGPMIIKRHLLGLRPARHHGRQPDASPRCCSRRRRRSDSRARLRPRTRSSPSSCSGVLCTATAFVILMVLVSEVGAGRASIITYINPVVAVRSACIVLGESPGTGAIAGLLLILAGSWLVDR